ncbi:MAG: uridylate kinase [Methylococcales bacterium]|nr:uridylate kinase [Methylococcales bacterium]
MRVVKLGGSLLESGKLFACLKYIAAQNKNTVVVCGGGVFADTVRNAQKKWHFDDVAAHEMAILAMQQTAILCQNLQPEFALISKTSEFKNHSLAIWSPDLAELNEAEIKPSWDVTSDSLAAWLAKKLDANELVIVKSCEVDSALSVAELTEQFIVDGEFFNFVAKEKFDLKVISATGFLIS